MITNAASLLLPKSIKMNTMKNYQVVLEKAFQVLLNTDDYQGDYSQKQVVQMLCNMGFSLSEGTLSNLRKEIKKHIAPRKAKKYGVQLKTLIKLILGLVFDVNTTSFIPTEDYPALYKL